MDEERRVDETQKASREPRGKRQAEVTLHQLRIFWAVAHSETLTRAAKQLGLAQPSLSQQVSKLETTVGTRLFERRSNQMLLTDAGTFLLRKAEHVLRGMRELEDGLDAFGDGTRGAIRIAGINSVLRELVPPALAGLRERYSQLEFDLHESAPAEVLEMLYARRVTVGLVASNSITAASVGFSRLPIMDDPYVLAVPQGLDLGGVTDPARDLDQPARDLLNRSIQFIFGSPYAKQIEEWYDHALPDHRVIARCRSFEVAIGMVRAGLGVCLVPALSALAGTGAAAGVKLYRINVSARQIVAVVPSQYLRVTPYGELLAALEAVGKSYALPPLQPVPPFLEGLDAKEI